MKWRNKSQGWMFMLQVEHVSGAENGAERAEDRVEQSEAVSGRGRKTMERSVARSGRSRNGNGAGAGGIDRSQPAPV